MTIKGRLLALVLIAALPVFLLSLWNEVDRRHQRTAEMAGQVLQAARLIAAEQEQFFENARTVLATYLESSAVQSGGPEACGAYLARLAPRFPHYTGLGVAAPDGTIVCSSIPSFVGLNLAERDYFREVLARRAFAVGDVTRGPASGRRIIGAAYPLLDDKGEVLLVGVLGLDLMSWSEVIAAPYLPPDSAVVVLDPAGTIMARAPGGAGSIGRPAPAEIVRAAEAADAEDGTRGIEDVDGVRRLYGFAPLVESERIAIGVGLPVAPLFADVDRLFWREMALLGAVFLLVAGVAWIGGEVTLRRPLDALQAAIDRIRAGDLSARDGGGASASAVPEFVRLGHSFDAMAESLEGHEAELQRANAELRRALDERNLLVREMNHRVKNSLQLVASMLTLQAGSSNDPRLREQLAEAQARVLTVARVHQRLYQTDSIATVEFAQYLRELCDEIAGSLQPDEEGGCRLVVEAEAADLPIVQAVPLALIANELVTNAFKYAYPAAGGDGGDGGGGVEGGTVAVRFFAAEAGGGGERRLEVADGGVGLPEGFDPETGGGLGMRLVRALVAQLEGRIEIDRAAPGVRFAVSVPAVAA